MTWTGVEFAWPGHLPSSGERRLPASPEDRKAWLEDYAKAMAAALAGYLIGAEGAPDGALLLSRRASRDGALHEHPHAPDGLTRTLHGHRGGLHPHAHPDRDAVSDLWYPVLGDDHGHRYAGGRFRHAHPDGGVVHGAVHGYQAGN
jgi:hypothetical protein